MKFALETMYKDSIKFSYTSFDRMVIRGHVPILQGSDGGGIVSWARSLEPDAVLTKEWLESFTAKFHINVKKFAEEHNIPILPVNQHQEKNEIAQKYIPREKDFTGVYLIIKSREMTSSFASQTSIHNSNPRHRNITRQERCVDHFYFYILDKYWGPISIRFSSHLPFNVKVFLNGNRWLYKEASRQGLSVLADDNAIIGCGDPYRLQPIADLLGEKRIRSLCDHWTYKLLPVLTYQERHKSGFRYQWFLHQIEFSHNMVFKNPFALTKLFHSHVALNYEHFSPAQIERFFGHRHKGNYDKNCSLRINHQTEAVTVLRIHSRGCSLKQYNKKQRVFRSEITTTNVRDLKVYKSLSNLAKLKKRMIEVLSSFQEAQYCAHQATGNCGQLTALAQPGKVASSRVAGIRLDNERILNTLALLPRLAHLPEGFRISDLRDLLAKVAQTNFSASQVSYDLRKLRAKNLIDCVYGQRRYKLNAKGAAVAVVLPNLSQRLCNPLIGSILCPTESLLPERFNNPLDRSYHVVEKEIANIANILNFTNTMN